jgi:PhnB protein
MRFMMIVKATKDSEAGTPPNPKLMAAVAKLAEEASRTGVMVDAGGLLPSSQGARIRVSGGKTSVLDGPFAETKELVGGYAIFELKSKEEAIQMGTDFMQIHGDILGPSYEGELEIRPIFGAPPNGAKQLNSYLHFNGQCEDAFKFYEKCLDGKIDAMIPYEGTPAAEQMSAEWRGKIVHAHMTVGEQVLMGMDAPPERFHKPQGFHVNIGVKDSAQGNRIFQALADHGNVVMPFGPTFWAAGFGMLIDRFGIPWMINCEQAA